ncbi:MAG: hypothetical protein ACRDGG_02215 [Anaerolineae bacterium]
MSEMRRRTQREEEDSSEPHGGIDVSGEARAGGDVVGRDKIQAGGDVAGRDIVNVDDRDVVNVGYSAKAVQRLAITVGALVFATAACFFSGGVVLGAVVFRELDRPVGSSPEAADAFQHKIDIAQSTSPGQRYTLEFTEEELSSFVKFNACELIGLCNGKARLLENGLVAVSGNLESLGNLSVAVTFRLQANSDQIVDVQSAAVQLFQIGNSTFGWVAIPNALVAPFADNIRRLLGGNYTVVGVQVQDAAQWAVTVEGK